MTRRVLVSPRLPTLRSGNAAIDLWVERHLQAFISQAFDQLAFLTPETDDFTAAIVGADTAGTYEIASQLSRYYRIGDFVMASSYVTLAGTITGGGAGNLNLTGLPYVKAVDHHPVGAVVLVGVNWTAGASLACSFTSSEESSALVFQETNDNAASSLVAVTGLAAGDAVLATICYTTNGERSA